eukprot:gnl/TRDRNA2_/TRDRNA2_37205_c0_seq1.p1 gnl/TRDRNA2_/TRDRNA2_37205_c0~~gnl/TRDRNA2_/TRDRNA2_37205_c0_seq1.p1  ORF type:complete len:127 (+),score=41.98 gnl/TRDRNA2_/TRDRNA2_37205_c0_seq1:64-444(+)
MRSFAVALLVVFALFSLEVAAIDAEASHILIKGGDAEAKCKELKATIESSGDVPGKFAELAKQHSTCPSGKKGGSLGKFTPGQMVKEFDEVVFKTGTVGKVSEPVKTQFGWHILLITRRGTEKMDL